MKNKKNPVLSSPVHWDTLSKLERSQEHIQTGCSWWQDYSNSNCPSLQTCWTEKQLRLTRRWVTETVEKIYLSLYQRLCAPAYWSNLMRFGQINNLNNTQGKLKICQYTTDEIHSFKYSPLLNETQFQIVFPDSDCFIFFDLTILNI